MNIEDSIKILDKFTTEHKLFNIKHSDGLEEAIETLLTAYEKEKEKNKELLGSNIENFQKIFADEFSKQFISKDKLMWKPITEYDRKKYDWVLVKYFDGDYECVPEVAEKRSDGKWYTSENQIPFEVKYFFDMQEILKEE